MTVNCRRNTIQTGTIVPAYLTPARRADRSGLAVEGLCMKIALTTPYLGGGGAERVAASLAGGWSERGHDVTIVTLGATEPTDYPLPPDVGRISLGLTGHSNSRLSGVLANLQRLRALRKALGSLRPDVTLGLTTEMAILTLVVARQVPMTVIACEHIHPPMMPLPAHWEWLRRKTYPRADRVAMLTEEGAAWLRSAIPSAKAVVVPNPVTFPLPAGDSKVLPDRLLRADDQLVLMVGRLAPQKNLALAIASFVHVAASCPDARLVVLGEGPDREALESQIASLGMKDRILLPGRSDNLAPWFRRARLLLLTSKFEGLPNVLPEAMAHGCPVISVDCPTGPRDIVTDGEDGILLPRESGPDAVADAVTRLLRDAPFRSALAARSLATRDRYQLQRILEHWDTVFDDLGINAARTVPA